MKYYQNHINKVLDDDNFNGFYLSKESLLELLSIEDVDEAWEYYGLIDVNNMFNNI